MNEANFAKGPWFTEYKEDRNGCYSQVVFDSISIGNSSWCPVDGVETTIDGKTYHLTTTNRKYNASLIAAAPSMYNMLEKLVDLDELQMCKSEIKEILAEARGENNE